MERTKSEKGVEMNPFSDEEIKDFEAIADKAAAKLSMGMQSARQSSPGKDYFAAPGAPPHPGLQWNEQTHRWIRPEEGSGGGDEGHQKNTADSSPIDKIKRLGQKGYAIYQKIEKPLTYAQHKTREIAVAAAKEHGLNDKQAAVLHRCLAIADFLGGFASGAAGAAIAGPIGAKVGGMLPTASAAFLAYSTARDPAATLRAARKVVAEAISRKGSHSDDFADLFAAHGPPPRPGLQWKEETHRWVSTEQKESHEETNPKESGKEQNPPEDSTIVDTVKNMITKLSEADQESTAVISNGIIPEDEDHE